MIYATIFENPMNTDAILKKYGISRDTTTAYIDAISRMNQTQSAEELDVSRKTIHRYKNVFQQMTEVERSLIIATLTQGALLERATE
jgi:DNA-binding XRE family transcriptional regulator